MRASRYILAVLALSACNSGDKLDTPTTGSIRIAVDETFEPLIDSEIKVFHALYTYANIHALYLPEAQVMKLLLDDSVHLAVLSRQLSTADSAFFKSKKLFPVTVEVAHDAIALITHPGNQDTSLTMDQLQDIFSGRTTQWNQLEKGNDLGEIQLVFDHRQSSTARYVRERFSQTLPANSYSADSNPKVVDHVAKNPNALGIIGVNYISDTDDSTSIDFLSRTNVLRIVSDSMDLRGKQPYQAYIAQGSYPLTRSVYMINSEGRSGLGTGFTSFVASDKGQSIVLKAGLVPATMPVRVIGFEN
jgi:phosphate transport system substrate-binding protein